MGGGSAGTSPRIKDESATAGVALASGNLLTMAQTALFYANQTSNGAETKPFEGQSAVSLFGELQKPPRQVTDSTSGAFSANPLSGSSGGSFGSGPVLGMFGKKPTQSFGDLRMEPTSVFGGTATGGAAQLSPSGVPSEQKLPGFGSQTSGPPSPPFATQSAVKPEFGSTSRAAIGSPSTPFSSYSVFGPVSSQVSSSPIGTSRASPFAASQSGSAFGSNSVFGPGNSRVSNTAFGSFNAEPFGVLTSGPAFGTKSVFGASSSQAGGTIFGSSNASPFGAPQSGSLLGTNSLFGATSSLSGGTIFGSSHASPFGAPQNGSLLGTNSPFGATSSLSGGTIFGSSHASPFGAPQNGSLLGTNSPFGATSSLSGGTIFGSSHVSPFAAPQNGSLLGTNSLFGATSSLSGGTIFASSHASPCAPGSSCGSSSNPVLGQPHPFIGFGGTPFGSTQASLLSAPQSSRTSIGFNSVLGQPTSVPGARSFQFGKTPFESSASPSGTPFTQRVTSSFTQSFTYNPEAHCSLPAGEALGTKASSPNAGTGDLKVGQHWGRRHFPFEGTKIVESELHPITMTILSISAMPGFSHKSPEELRWENNQAHDKGGASAVDQQTAQDMFGQPSPSPFVIKGVFNVGALSIPAVGVPSRPGAIPNDASGGQHVGSRVPGYAGINETNHVEFPGNVEKLLSICSLPAYNSKSPEELRWEDSQANDKGGNNPSRSSLGVFGQPASIPSLSDFKNSVQKSATDNGAASSLAAGFSSIQAGQTPLGASSCWFQPPASLPLSASKNFLQKAAVSPASSTLGVGSPAFWERSREPQSSVIASSNLSGFGEVGNPELASVGPRTWTGFGKLTLESPTSVFGNTTPGHMVFFTFTSLSPSSNTGVSQSSSQPAPFAETKLTASNQSSSPLTFSSSGQSVLEKTSVCQPSFLNLQPLANSLLGLFPAQPPVPTSSPFGTPPIEPQGSTTCQIGTLPQQPPVSTTSLFGTHRAQPQLSTSPSSSSVSSGQYGISSMPVSDKNCQLQANSMLSLRHVPQRSRIRMHTRKGGVTVNLHSI